MPPGHGPGGPGGPMGGPGGPMGGRYAGGFAYYSPLYYNGGGDRGYGPIVQGPGHTHGQYTPPTSGSEDAFLETHNFVETMKKSVKDKGPLGVVTGTGNFLADPVRDFRYDTTKASIQREFRDGVIDKDEYAYRMIRNEERYLYNQLKRKVITQEQYDSALDKAEEELGISHK